jgi:methylmalonyl-CoA/ethylmalonyl-CoA epimerase
MDLRLHHIGIAVRDIVRATEDHLRRLGCRPVGEKVHDPVQTAMIQFLSVPGDPVLIELVAPDGPKSTLAAAVKRSVGINHLCYSTDDIEAACEFLREDGMVVIQDPTPAVAFGGRRIAWLMGEEWYLTELVERDAQAESPNGAPLG